MAGYVLWEGRLDASLLSFFCTQAQPDIMCHFRSQKEACSLCYSSYFSEPLVSRRAALQPTAALDGDRALCFDGYPSPLRCKTQAFLPLSRAVNSVDK